VRHRSTSLVGLRGLVLITSILACGLAPSITSAAEAPECDSEELLLYTENPLGQIKSSLILHVSEIKKKGAVYEGYPDLACFIHLFASVSSENDTPAEKAEWLAGQVDSKTAQSLLADARGVGSFLFDTFYSPGLCVIEALAAAQSLSADCEPKIRKVALAIDSLKTSERQMAEQNSGQSSGTTAVAVQGSTQAPNSLVWCLLGGDQFEATVSQYSVSFCKASGGEEFETRREAIVERDKRNESRKAQLATQQVWCVYKTEYTWNYSMASKESCRDWNGTEAASKEVAVALVERLRGVDVRVDAETAQLPTENQNPSASTVNWCNRYPDSFACEQQKIPGGTSDSIASASQTVVDPQFVVYNPLAIRAKPSDERFCYEVWKKQIEDTDGDPNKQTGIDFCWDFLNLEGTWWISDQENLVLGPNRQDLMEKNFFAHMLGATFLGGSLPSMYRVARALRVGRGTERDSVRAFEFYLKAAKKGHTKSQYFVGLMYAEGEGVSKDLSQAIAWLERASTSGDGDAMAYLGYLLEFGIGITKDINRAKRLYRSAASMGQPFAQQRVNRVGTG